MFIKWLIGDMGTPGDYSYQGIHLISVATVAAVTVIFLIGQVFLNRQPDRKRWLLTAVCVFQLVFEVSWRLVYVFVKKAPLTELWPAYPCNLGGVLIPIIALTNWKKGKKLFYLFSFVGAVITFAIPEGIFCTDVFVFPLLKSVLQHTGILLIPLMEYVMNTYRPSLRDLGWVLLGCLVHLANSEGITRLLGLTGDYMFFRSGLPLVIPGVSQFITLSVFATVVLALLCFLSDTKNSVTFLRSFKKISSKST